MSEIAVALVDDDTLIVNLLQGYLTAQGGIRVLFTASSGEEFLETLKQAEQIPDVLLLDLKMKGMTGIEVTEFLKINYPSIRIIVVSSHYNKAFMGFMLKTGVMAFVPKGISPVKLVEIIREVSIRGFYFLDEQVNIIREQISGKSPKPDVGPENSLSDRETEILKLICMQKTAKEIGDQLFITQRTVEGHKNNLFVKTGAKNVAGLVIYALQQGIISLDEMPLI